MQILLISTGAASARYCQPTGRGCCFGILCGQSNNCNLDSAEGQPLDCEWLHFTRKAGVTTDVNVATNDRGGESWDERGENGGAIVKLRKARKVGVHQKNVEPCPAGHAGVSTTCVCMRRRPQQQCTFSAHLVVARCEGIEPKSVQELRRDVPPS